MAKGKRTTKRSKPVKKSYSVRRYKKRASNFALVKSLVIPRTQFIKIVDEFTGYIPNSAVSNGFATIYAAKLYQPYDTGADITDASFGSLIATSGVGVSQNFAGYNVISGMYNQYKVWGSKLTIQCRPEGSTDTVIFGCFPWNVDNQTTLTSMDIDEYIEQPYSTHKVAYSQVQTKVVNKVSPPTILGLTKLQYKVMGSTSQLTEAPNDNLNYNYLVYWRTLDNQNLSSNLTFTFRLERLVQFSGPNNLTN